MLFYTHILLGIVAYLLSASYFKGGFELVLFLLVLLGSILPDIDEQRSTINKWSGALGKVVAFFTTHRGIMHSAITFLLLSLIVKVFVGSVYAQALFVGYLAHLFGDVITPQGVAPFHPFFPWKLRGPIRVGGIIEQGLVVCLVGIIVLYLLKQW